MNVLVADDYELIVDGLRVVLREIDPEVTVLPAADAAGALDALRQADGADLAILSLRMPGMEELRGLDEVVAAFPDLPVVVIADELNHREAVDCLRRGASGCVPKTFSKCALAAALTIVLEGQPFLPADCVLADGAGEGAGDAAGGAAGATTGAAAGAKAKDLFSNLTPKERLVLRELATGSPNKDIASRLGLEEATVKFHLQRIFRKLGTHNRGETIRLATLGDL